MSMQFSQPKVSAAELPLWPQRLTALTLGILGTAIFLHSKETSCAAVLGGEKRRMKSTQPTTTILPQLHQGKSHSSAKI